MIIIGVLKNPYIMKNKFILYMLLAISSSCQNKQNQSIDSKDRKNNYRFIDTKKIKKFNNEGRYFYSFLSQVLPENQLMRKIDRIDKYGVDIYKFYQEKTNQSIILDEYDLRELKRVRGVYYKNKDSIFFIGINKFIIKNNNNQQLYSKYYNNPENNSYFPVIITNDSPPFIYNHTLYFTKLIDLKPGDNYYNSNLLIAFDLKKDSLYELKHTNYPMMYYNKCFLSNELSLKHTKANKDLVILNYPIDDTLYIYSLKKQKIIDKKKIRSKYKKGEVKSTDCSKIWDTKTYWKHLYTSYLYNAIIYDKYRNIYYRLVKLPKKDYDLNKKYNSMNIPFSIMVLDKDFNILAESEILNIKPEFIWFDYFVNKDGLWISVNNPDNPDYNEDTLKFKLFKLEKNEK